MDTAKARARVLTPVPSPAALYAPVYELPLPGNKEKVDPETILIKDVITLLQRPDEGLTEDEAIQRLGLFGINELETKERNAPILVRPPLLPLRPEPLTSPCATVPWLYVESALVGHGGRLVHLHCAPPVRAARPTGPHLFASSSSSS